MRQKKIKHSFKVGDTVVLNLQASSIITEKFGNSVVKISKLEYDDHFGPCYCFEGLDGSWQEACISHKGE